MIGLLQRVSAAHVEVAGERVGSIGPGLLVLVGVERNDGEGEARRLAERIVGYRVFADDTGRMNRSLLDVGGGLLAVPQFTLAADTRKGTRPSFSSAAGPDAGHRLFEQFCDELAALGVEPRRGRFGADMQVGLVNDGPVTFWIQV